MSTFSSINLPVYLSPNFPQKEQDTNNVRTKHVILRSCIEDHIRTCDKRAIIEPQLGYCYAILNETQKLDLLKKIAARRCKVVNAMNMSTSSLNALHMVMGRVSTDEFVRTPPSYLLRGPTQVEHPS